VPFVHTISKIKRREVKNMRKPRKKSFADLVNENKKALMMDAEAINAIEERVESRLEVKRMNKAE
jgi:hypothetical protein